MKEIFYGVFEEARKNNEIDEYIKSKITFVNEREDFSKATKDNYLKLFKSFVYYLENIKKKDLYDFSKTEIMELVKTAPTTSMRTKSGLLSAINGYCRWAIERGKLYGNNPCDTINTNDILVVNKEAVKHNYYQLPDFWKIIKKLETKNDLNNLIILILLRYGISTKNIPFVKWEDINREEKKLYLYSNDRKLLTILDVDDTFIEYIDKTYDYNSFSYEAEVRGHLKVKVVDYITGEYVLKTTTKQPNNTGVVTDSIIYNRYNSIFNNNNIDGETIKRIATTDLIRSRKFDELYKIYNEKGELTTKDVKIVNSKFNLSPSPSATTSLKIDFENVSGVEVSVDRKNEKKKPRQKSEIGE